MRKIIIIPIVFLAAVVLFNLFGLAIVSFLADIGTPSKEDIVKYVNTNSDELSNVVSEVTAVKEKYESMGYGIQLKSIGHTDINKIEGIDGLYAEIYTLKSGNMYKKIDCEAIEKVLNKKPVQGICIDDDGIFFECGGRGLVPDTVYYGFYYSFDGNPKDYCNGGRFGSSEQMKPEDGGYIIKTPNDDNYCYSEKITGSFYYSEAGF